MPLCLEKVAFTSSSAFFSEAAAKTVTVFSCAEAGAVAKRQVKTKTIIDPMAGHDASRRSLILNCEAGNRRSGIIGRAPSAPATTSYQPGARRQTPKDVVRQIGPAFTDFPKGGKLMPDATPIEGDYDYIIIGA